MGFSNYLQLDLAVSLDCPLPSMTSSGATTMHGAGGGKMRVGNGIMKVLQTSVTSLLMVKNPMTTYPLLIPHGLAYLVSELKCVGSGTLFKLTRARARFRLFDIGDSLVG